MSQIRVDVFPPDQSDWNTLRYNLDEEAAWLPYVKQQLANGCYVEIVKL